MVARPARRRNPHEDGRELEPRQGPFPAPKGRGSGEEAIGQAASLAQRPILPQALHVLRAFSCASFELASLVSDLKEP